MNKEILKLAIPNIISNISVPLLSTVDTALMGRLSAAHIAAVGIGGLIFNFIYWNFGFLRMGTTGLTAQAFGAKSSSQQSTILFQALFVGLALAIVILISAIPIMQLSEGLLNLNNDQTDFVKTYFFIRILDAPATMMLYGILGWLFGMQNALYPLILTILINVCNIILSYLLVSNYGFGIAGVAWGSVIAQYFGVVCGLILINLKFGDVFTYLPKIGRSFFQSTKLFLAINSDIFFRTVCLTLAFGIFYSFSSDTGPLILAANVVLLLFVNWMSYAIDGFAYAAESLVGKYKGERNPTHLKKVIIKIFYWALGSASFIALIYGLFSDALTRMFTDQVEVIEVVSNYSIWVVLFPVLAFACYIWDGVFIGLTAVKSMRNSMLVAFILFVPTIYFAGQWYGNHGLWAGLLLFMVYRGVFQTLLYNKKGLALN